MNKKIDINFWVAMSNHYFGLATYPVNSTKQIEKYTDRESFCNNRAEIIHYSELFKRACIKRNGTYTETPTHIEIAAYRLDAQNYKVHFYRIFDKRSRILATELENCYNGFCELMKIKKEVK